jgi:hypothetical protein
MTHEENALTDCLEVDVVITNHWPALLHCVLKINFTANNKP